MFEVRQGDCVELMRAMSDASVGAVITDPPYHLAFMGRSWDTVTPGQSQHEHERWATEAFRVLKPGGHLLAFGGTRTYHRLACAVEDAGFEIRDTIAWMYGSGFPKSLNVGAAIDKAAGAERESLGLVKGAASQNTESLGPYAPEYEATAPATPEAERWQGWGTALKPAHEPIVVARKPLSGTVAQTVLEHGTGALNVDGCRIEGAGPGSRTSNGGGEYQQHANSFNPIATDEHPAGRWPANVVLSHTEGCVQVGTRKVKGNGIKPGTGQGVSHSAMFGNAETQPGSVQRYGDADGCETVGAWSCTPGYRVPAFTLGGLSVALGVSPEQEVEDLLALVLHRVHATGSHTADTQTTPAHGPSDDRWPSSPQGSPVDYPACPRCDDERARLTGAGGQPSPQLLVDVLESVLCRESSPQRSHAGSLADPSIADGSDLTATETRNPPNRTAAAQPVAAPTAARTPSDTKRTSPSPLPRAGLRGSTQPSSTFDVSGAARATPCHSGHRCSGFLPLVSVCLTSLRAYVPLSVEHIEWGDCPVRLLDEQTGETTGPTRRFSPRGGRAFAEADGFGGVSDYDYGDTGGASRFFYCAKSSRQERNAGLEGFEERLKQQDYGDGFNSATKLDPKLHTAEGVAARPLTRNHHPTVKPIELMRWLVRLVTPPNGTVLDPFAGSGTTGCACALEGFDFVGLEREQEYVDIARARIAWWHKHRGDGEAAAVLAAGAERDAVEAAGQLGLDF